MNWMTLVIGAYLIGAVPFGLLLGRFLAGRDVREHGSGNIGATNVWRVCGPRIGAAAFACDLVKGFGPTFWAAPALVPEAVELAGALAALATVVGHTFPVYLRFRGGKGVATSAGALLALMPLATGIAVGVFAAILAAGRYVSVASTAAAVAILVARHLVATEPYGVDLPGTVLVWAVFLLVVVRHRSNYRRLLNGTESRIGRSRRGEDEGAAPAQRHA
jgi:glycerol-3-phosphate acyltransferase PlsY